MCICTLAALKKPLKEKKTEIEKIMVEECSKFANDCRKKAGKQKIRMFDFFTLT